MTASKPHEKPSMTRPQQIMVEAIMDALRPHASQLREDGWPVDVDVTHHEITDSYEVALKVRIPYYPKPVETALEEEWRKLPMYFESGQYCA